MNDNLARVPGFVPQNFPNRHPSWSRLSKNYMEVLVREEVECQVNQLPPDLKQVVNYADIAAYALNRLPAMYATTKRGRMIQQWKVEAALRQSVREAVQAGITVFRNHPRQPAEPWEDPESQSVEAVLEELKGVLQYQDLNWDNLVTVIKSRIIQLNRREIDLASKAAPASERLPGKAIRSFN